MKTVNLVKRAGKTGGLCLKAIALNAPEVHLAVFDKFSTLDRVEWCRRQPKLWRAGQSRCVRKLGHHLSDGDLSFWASSPA